MKLWVWLVNAVIYLHLRWKDFFDPVVAAHPCGCGELFPDANCVRCHGTGIRHKAARRVSLWKPRS